MGYLFYWQTHLQNRIISLSEANSVGTFAQFGMLPKVSLTSAPKGLTTTGYKEELSLSGIPHELNSKLKIREQYGG